MFWLHTCVNIDLSPLDVQVVLEHIDHVDSVIFNNGIGVAREQHKGNIANVVTLHSIHVFQLQRRSPGCEAGSVSFSELLYEHLSNDHSIFILNDCAEDYGGSVLLKPNIHGLIIPTMDHCPVLSFLALFSELEIFLKDRGKTILFQHASLPHHGILGCRQIAKVI